MKKLAVFLGSVGLVLGLSSCGYSGFYRYPCQDPANWETAECKPPVCTASQTCPVDLVKTLDGTTATIEGAPNE
jgi:hypothetical protein